MAKVSAVEKNKRRERLVKRYEARRARLKEQMMDQSLSLEERFKASIRLAEVPRNSTRTRLRNRCEVTGRPRAFYRKLKMSRVALRELGSLGLVPGVVKSSW